MSFNVKYNGKWYDAMKPSKPTTYGVKIQIANSSPNDAVTYIDDAEGFTPMTRNSPGSWAGNPLIKDIKPVCRKSDGTWVDLDKRNLSNGVDITTVGNDVFTRVPTWYLSITTDAEYDYIRFCPEKIDDTYFDLASLFNGERKGMFHMGCYHAYNSGNKLYSSANKSPSVNISTENFRQYAQARGAGFDQIGYYHTMYLQALFVLLFKGRNGQELIGKGYTGASSVTTENRTTYDNDYGMAGSSSGTDQMAFFWINNWWGNIYDFIGGAKVDGSRKLMTLDKGQLISYADNAGWVIQTSSGSTSGDYISKMNMASSKSGFFPMKSSGASATTYWCDGGDINATRFPALGGNYEYGDYAGPFHWSFGSSISNTPPDVGSHLVYREKVE